MLPILRMLLLAAATLGITDGDEPGDRWSHGRATALAITGLPPTFDDLQEYVADPRPDAIQRWTDRLIADPASGEHFARHWLDLVRYADTHGGNLDNRRNIWPYRDWVIDAWSDGMPLDKFLTHQLAGDLIDGGNAALIASGFNRLNPTTNENGVIPAEARIANVRDRVDAFGTVVLGMTVRCAACHDHPYESITQEDYYSLGAFFDGLAGHSLDGDIAAPPPVLRLPTEQPTEQLAFLDDQLAAVIGQLRQYQGRIDSLRQLWQSAPPPETLQRRAGHGWRIAVNDPAAAEEWCRRFRPSFPLAADEAFIIDGQTAAWQSLPIAAALTPVSIRNDHEGLIARVQRFQAEAERTETIWTHGPASVRWFWNGQPVELIADATGRHVRRGSVWVQKGVNELCFLASTGPSRTVPVAAAVGNHAAPPPRPNPLAAAYFVDQVCDDPEVTSLNGQIALWRRAIAEVQSGVASTLVWREVDNPPPSFVLLRGDPNQPGPAVARNTPRSMPPLSSAGRRPNRLDLARWATGPMSEVTAPVAVGRLWGWITGQSMQDTQLLESLSRRLIDSGWDTKRLIRDIVELRSDDEARRRLDGEVIRDSALATAGLLDRRCGGPGVFPPQPPGAWAAVAAVGSDTGRYVADGGADAVRRSIYTFWKRTAGPAFVAALDGPDRSVCTEFRDVTDTPVQAMMLIGDPQRIEAAVAIARRTGGDRTRLDAAWLGQLFQTIVLRPPSDGDNRRLIELAERFRQRYTAEAHLAESLVDVPDAELASAAAVALTLMNLDEVLCR